MPEKVRRYNPYEESLENKELYVFISHGEKQNNILDDIELFEIENQNELVAAEERSMTTISSIRYDTTSRKWEAWLFSPVKGKKRSQD